MRRWGFFCAVLLVCSCAFADVISVPTDANDIQEAINGAVDGDIVVVEPGIYYENLDMDGKAITLMSTNPNDPVVIAGTIIDGGGNTSVIYCGSGEGAETVIFGLTLQNGDSGNYGGGVNCFNSSPTIRNCVFINNAAGYGGGVFCYTQGASGESLIANCVFIGNIATAQGGGLYCWNAGPTVMNCTFSGNDADNGGGLSCRDKSLQITNCTFSGNSAGTGGGLYFGNNSDSTVSNCIFWGNSATTRPEIYVASTSDPVIRYSVAQGSGGSGAGWKSWYGIDGGYNLDDDPLFGDPDGVDDVIGTVDDDLHIDPNSVCVNAGDPNMVYTGQVDMDFQDRVLDGRVDIGADEVLFFTFSSDLNTDGQVDLADLILFVDSDFWLVMVDLNEFAQFSRDWLVGVAEVGDLSGNGSEGNPYLIQNLADFDIFSDPNNAAIYWAGGVHTKLMTDIDLSDRIYTTAVIAPDVEDSDFWVLDGVPFSGVFNGNGFTVNNLTIDTAGADHEYLGLFGLLYGVEASIKNVGIRNVTVAAGNDSFYVGGLAGRNDYGYISGCYSNGAIVGNDSVGGFVGYNDGIIVDSYAQGSVAGGTAVGGLVGTNGRGLSTAIENSYSNCTVNGVDGVGGLAGKVFGNIENCYAGGAVTGDTEVGGLCGTNYFGLNEPRMILNSYATGSVQGNDLVGGLAGSNHVTIQRSFSTGSVEGVGSIGGLVGANSSTGSLVMCYSQGNVSNLAEDGSGSAGGIAGETGGAGLIRHCYAAGTVSGTGTIGGIMGNEFNYANYESCYWDLTRNPLLQDSGSRGEVAEIFAESTVGLKLQSTFTGWDFSTPEWMMLRAGEDYPRLAWQEIYDGDIAGLYGVDMADFAEAAKHWGLDDCNGADKCGRADIDEDGQVGLGDLVRIADDWLRA